MRYIKKIEKESYYKPQKEENDKVVDIITTCTCSFVQTGFLFLFPFFCCCLFSHFQLKSTVRCLTCGNTNNRFDPFTFLSLPLPMEDSIYLEVIRKLSVKMEVFSEVFRKLSVKCGKFYFLFVLSLLLVYPFHGVDVHV